MCGIFFFGFDILCVVHLRINVKVFFYPSVAVSNISFCKLSCVKASILSMAFDIVLIFMVIQV